MLAKIGNSRKPFVVVRLVCFPDTEKAYITAISNIKASNIQYLDSSKIIKSIKDKLREVYDYELISNEFPVKRLTTADILKEISNN
jgi:hypothetical protein